MDQSEKHKNILGTLAGKSIVKQSVYDNTAAGFGLFREALRSVSKKLNTQLATADPRIRLVYREKSEFDVDLKVAGDMLVFNMHSNIFQFEREHDIWKSDYIKKDVMAGYSGIISIYNFLSDSFKYRRSEDLGYLIARIFINKNNHFFVQGKRQSGFNYATLGSKQLDLDSVNEIVLAAIKYCLDFDLLVPPYDSVKLINLGQVEKAISDSRLKTGKRLGYQFSSDDVDE